MKTKKPLTAAQVQLGKLRAKLKSGEARVDPTAVLVIKRTRLT
jgi:hypothetical protein